MGQLYDKAAAETFLRQLPAMHNTVFQYRKYWDAITPVTHEDVCLRWIFSFMSVRTRWQDNVKGYLAVRQALRDCDFGVPEKDKLMAALKISETGLYERRCEGIFRFMKAFHDCPVGFTRTSVESIKDCRDRIEPRMHGLGMAKTSFALEMLYPHDQEVTCLDTHMLRLYRVVGTDNGKNISSGVKPTLYREIEQHWCDTCREVGVPSPIARHIWWDRLQGKQSTDYWSYVFKL